MRRILFILPVCIALACDSGTSGGTGKTGDGKTGDGKTGGGGGTPAPAKNAPPDAWESWNACGAGSMIEFEMETSGMKMRQVKTLDKKGDEHVLKTEMIMKVGDNETKTPGEEKVAKTKAGGTDGECPACKKKFSEHKDEGKWSDENVKVGDKDVKCQKYETAAKTCDGKDMPKSTMWYSKDVPGGMVKMETAQMKMTLVKFEKK